MTGGLSSIETKAMKSLLAGRQEEPMPLLFYGTTGKLKKPRLHGIRLQRLEGCIFKYYTQLGRLAPKNKGSFVARAYRIKRGKCSALAWLDGGEQEQIIFVPNQDYSISELIAIARTHFGEVMPSPVEFRVLKKVKKL